MKYLSLFSGIGGFELGIEKAYAYISDTKRTKQGRDKNSMPDDKQQQVATQPFCIGFSEIDEHAINIYKKHFPKHKNYGDIKKIKAEELPDFDVLFGGFPCQSFSIAGQRRGFSDTRGTLFFDIARIIKQKQPRFFVLENVKGLLSHDKGQTFLTIITTLNELGYDLQWQVLNSKYHGVPQNRERVYIIGSLRGEPRPRVFPFRGGDEAGNEEVTANTIDANYSKGIDNHGQRTAIVHNIYGGFKEKEIRIFTEHAPTIRTSAGGGHLPSVVKGMTVRMITPKECERLQGFPDDWTKAEVEQTSKIKKKLGIKKYTSKTQRYKCIGNAVTTNVIRDIMIKIYGY